LHLAHRSGWAGAYRPLQRNGADEAVFPDRANFVNRKSGGLLASADDAASCVLTYLARPDFGAQPVADARD